MSTLEVIQGAPPNVAVVQGAHTVAVSQSSSEVSVVESVSQVAISEAQTSVVEVQGPVGYAISDDPYLAIKRLRELGPSVTTYTYNADGTVATKAIEGAETFTYSYDGDGNLTSYTDGTYMVALLYNGDGDLETVTRS